MSRTALLRESQSSPQLHTLLREQLREAFDKQPRGGRVSSERSLAKEFGVSTATVSRALQELQQEGILRRIPGKGTYLAGAPAALHGNAAYAPGPLETSTAPRNDETSSNGVHKLAPAESAPATRPAESNLNAWVIALLESYETSFDRSSEFWPQRIVSRLEYLIAGQGGRTKITLGHTLTEQQCVEAWQTALAEKINCIFFIVNERNPLVDVWVEQLISSHIGIDSSEDRKRVPAIVQISLSATPQSYFDTISFDGEWGAYLAAAHLLQLGHRNIAFLAPSTNSDWVEHRILGFHRAMRGFGVRIPRDAKFFGVVRTGPVPDGPRMWHQLGEDAANRVAPDTSITAVLATNDQMASAFIERARVLGRSIPDSLSVVGYDDWFSSAMHGLTTVRPPIDEIADAALQLAKKQQEAPRLRDHTHLFLKPTLMVRTTTRELAT